MSQGYLCYLIIQIILRLNNTIKLKGWRGQNLFNIYSLSEEFGERLYNNTRTLRADISVDCVKAKKENWWQNTFALKYFLSKVSFLQTILCMNRHQIPITACQSLTVKNKRNKTLRSLKKVLLAFICYIFFKNSVSSKCLLFAGLIWKYWTYELSVLVFETKYNIIDIFTRGLPNSFSNHKK